MNLIYQVNVHQRYTSLPAAVKQIGGIFIISAQNHHQGVQYSEASLKDGNTVTSSHAEEFA